MISAINNALIILAIAVSMILSASTTNREYSEPRLLQEVGALIQCAWVKTVYIMSDLLTII
jgi:hypothetical protein